MSQKEPGLRGSIKSLFNPKFEERVALSNLDLEVKSGELVGYIGVNGAGKSTTIKMLVGVLAPTSGQVRVLGRDPMKERIENTKRVGVVFGQRSQLWWDIALEESLRLLGKINQIPDTEFERTFTRFVHVLGLEELLRKPIREMSLGQKMRAEFAAALIHKPAIVYLDEPTIGLDIVVKERVREFIKAENKKERTTFILTTHDLSDIEELCSRVVVIDAGKKIFDGTLDILKDKLGRGREITFELFNDGDPKLEMLENCSYRYDNPRKLVIEFDRNKMSANQVVKSVITAVDIKDFSIKEPSLESIISRIYKRSSSSA